MKRFKFIGDTKHGMGFINGHIYELSVMRPSLVQRFLSGQMTWRVLIIAPKFCPYTSEEAFKANWQEVEES